MQRSTEGYVRTVPGFVSANWHMSLDRRHVTNYAQWRSKADLEAFMADPIGRESIGEGSAIAMFVNPILYTLRTTHARRRVP
ncbi:antibiotic biosynthesis monooxygenase family protein [Caballeronia terrestris]|uniref:antibiotic biosynthesis monooxygenase family protein n=1 Tax=Caballeronia terrestris TaxID=1226301 RepID=UPI0035B53B6E